MTVGVDVDGVLADFNTAFIDEVIRVTGQDRFGPRPVTITTWNYPQELFGYTDEQIRMVWDSVKANSMFWQSLPDYPWTKEALFYLRKLEMHGHDVYFITNRMGVDCKAQTYRWLHDRAWGGGGVEEPSVLISGKKGTAAKALDLDFYIDDKPENCQDVAAQSRSTAVALFNQSWNTEVFEGEGVTRTDRVAGFCELLASQS